MDLYIPYKTLLHVQYWPFLDALGTHWLLSYTITYPESKNPSRRIVASR